MLHTAQQTPIQQQGVPDPLVVRSNVFLKHLKTTCVDQRTVKPKGGWRWTAVVGAALIWDPEVLLCRTGGRRPSTWAGNQKLKGAVSCFVTEIIYRTETRG